MLNQKRIIGSLLLLALVSMLLAAIEEINTKTSMAGDLACDDLTNCTSKASCGGPGNPSGCIIECENGAVITCPRKAF